MAYDIKVSHGVGATLELAKEMPPVAVHNGSLSDAAESAAVRVTKRAKSIQEHAA